MFRARAAILSSVMVAVQTLPLLSVRDPWSYIACLCSAGQQRSLSRREVEAYLLGLLAMIKCSICSYQCDNWYISNWRFDCHINFCQGGYLLSLLRLTPSVALAPHTAGCSTPFGETSQIQRCFSNFGPGCERMTTEGHAFQLANVTEVFCGLEIAPVSHPCGKGNSATSDA